MKFDTYIHEIAKNNLPIFRKDPCTNMGTRGKNMRARVSSRQTARAHVYVSCVPVCAWIFFEKSFNKTLLSYEYKSQIS